LFVCLFVCLLNDKGNYETGKVKNPSIGRFGKFWGYFSKI
jgi:hypothetical protein